MLPASRFGERRQKMRRWTKLVEKTTHLRIIFSYFIKSRQSYQQAIGDAHAFSTRLFHRNETVMHRFLGKNA